MAVRKTEGDESKVFRLRNIETEEVSIVDRPANQQTFLVVKRGEMGKESSDEKCVSKAGAKMSKENLDRLARALESLMSLQVSLKPKPQEESKSEPKKKSAPVKESVEQKVGGGGRDAQTELFKRLNGLAEQIEKQDKTIDSLRSRLREQPTTRGVVTGGSQALDIEVTKRSARNPSVVAWPRDLNSPETVDKF